MKWPLTLRDRGAEKVVKTKKRVRSVFWFQVPKLGTALPIFYDCCQKESQPRLPRALVEHRLLSVQ